MAFQGVSSWEEIVDCAGLSRARLRRPPRADMTRAGRFALSLCDGPLGGVILVDASRFERRSPTRQARLKQQGSYIVERKTEPVCSLQTGECSATFTVDSIRTQVRVASRCVGFFSARCSGSVLFAAVVRPRRRGRAPPLLVATR